MRMTMTFPGGSRVRADFDGHHVLTDQPVDHGGDGSAPAPFDLFLASIGTCAGYYVIEFLRQRGIDPEGASLEMSTVRNRQSHMIDSIRIDVLLPPTVPAKYETAILRAINLCSVKRHLEQPPAVHATVVVGETVRSRSSRP